MLDLIIGVVLIIIGLSIAGLGGTMSNITQALFYIIGFLLAFAGLGFLLKYYRKTSNNKGEK